VGELKHLFQIRPYIYLLLVVTLSITNSAQTINKGLWYHQQPTSVNDSGSFFGEKENFEGFCGLAASEMVLQYFIPNIHSLLYNIYGPVDYHDDNRGGLRDSDPWCYSPYYTYTFQDFLGHKYINRHITKTGCSYREIEGLLKNIDADIPGYTLELAWITRNQINDYLDKGYLIIMNTSQGGGHYVLIGGWESGAGNRENCMYYIWDSWKYPLDIDSTQFTYASGIAGNEFNKGTASLINTYKITSEGFTRIFKDQMGDGTMPAIKFTPAVSYSGKRTIIKSKALLLVNGSIEDKNINCFIDTISCHNITDLFVPVEDQGSIFTTDLLYKITGPAHSKNIKVHALCKTPDYRPGITSVKYKKAGGIQNSFPQQILEPLCHAGVDGICFNYNDSNNAGKKNKMQALLTAVRTYLNTHNYSNILLGVTIDPVVAGDTKTQYKNIRTIEDNLNYIIPLLFTHDNNENPVWLGMNISHLKSNLKGKCEIWPAIQTLDSSDNYMASLEMKQCIENAAMNGASGIVLSRYPVAEWQWEIYDSTR
jgi:hypothetical protein